MKKKLMFLALAAIGLASCNGGFKKGEKGLLYNIVVDKSGPSIQPGDFVSLNLTLKTDADSVIGSTRDNGIPFMQPLQKPQTKGTVVDGLLMLSEGDSAVIKVNIDSMFKGQPRPPGLKGKYEVYLIKVEKVIAKGNLSDQVFQGRAEAYVKSVIDVVKKAESGKIKSYVDKNNLKMSQTPDGLYYTITKEGSGPKPAQGDTAVLNYTVKFISGKVLESSVKAEAIKAKLQINPMNPFKPIRFAIGAKGMIPGMDEGAQLLNKGATATLVVPSKLAYGEQGSGGQIQPFTPLVFDIELVDIVHPDPNAPKPKPMSMIPPQPVQTQQPTKK
ncbi:MAG TPA: FKBP-type peptidyl-prolyl cis-trans isomerase [Mucilaginibacter sp.]|jgi:FKBP-type peptidyl-prolyl cis-trans isomerase